MPKTNEWLFIELFYLGYQSCDNVMLDDDFSCYLSKQIDRKTFNERQSWLIGVQHKTIVKEAAKVRKELENSALEDFYNMVKNNQIEFKTLID